MNPDSTPPSVGLNEDALARLGASIQADIEMIDPERDLTVIFLSAGFIEGLRHIERVQRINDLALAAVDV